jgi:hypothetical protein
MIGTSLPIASAWSRSRASTTNRPASASLLSTNGPFVTMSPRMVVAVAFGCSASAWTMLAPSSSTWSGTRPCASRISGGMSAMPPGSSFS